MLFYPSFGGIETFLFNAAKILLKLKHEPTIYCSQHKKELQKAELFQNIEIIRHPRPYLPFPATVFNPVYYVKKLQDYLKDDAKDADMIWSWHPYYCYASSRMFKSKKPVIYLQAFPFPRFLRNNFAHSGFAKQAYINCVIPQAYLIEKKAIEICDKISVVSYSEQKEISLFYGVSPDKFTVIPPGVDLERFKPGIRNEALLSQLGLNSDAKIILTAGRLTPQKNIEMLIRAFSLIDKKNMYLIIIGDGWQRAYLEKLAGSLGKGDKVKFLGFRQDVERFFSIADIFVLPSRYEGFGIVFLEAMASGVPCIGLKSDFPRVIVATEEIIDDGETGYSIEPYSIEDMASKMKSLIESESLRIKMSSKARTVCEQRYSWERCVNSILQLADNEKLQR